MSIFYNNNNNKSVQNLLSIDNTYNYAYKGINISNFSNMLENTNFNKNRNKNANKIFVNEKLFPYKYYFFSVFVKNLNSMKDNCLFSSRFSKIYTFLGQLFDITTYLCLQREFNALKRLFNDDNRNLIEENKKININSKNFINDISDCIGEQKLYILAQDINRD